MSSAPLYLAIDQGSHASRALVFDAHGVALAQAQVALSTRRPQPGWVEHDPEELLASVEQAVAGALNAPALGGRTPVAAGLAIQRSSIVCWDRNDGTALSPVLSWQDRRYADWLAAMALDAEQVRRSTGLVVSPHYGASKLRWCLEHLPAVQRALDAGRLRCGPLASFVLHRLLKERPEYVDPANASRTLLWDVATGDWSPALLAAFGIPAGCLPHCVPNHHDFGTLTDPGRPIPFTVVTGDQSAALFAWGEPAADTLYVNLGTGAFVQRTVDAPLPPAALLRSGLLHSMVWQDRSRSLYVLEGTVNGAGSALQWLAEREDAPVETLLAGAEDWLSAGGEPPLFLNGVGGLGSPFWRADCPSRFSAGGTRAERTLAVLESIVFLLHVNVEAIAAIAGPAARIQVGGGLAQLDGLCRRLADLSGLPVHRPETVEATARGLAWLLAAPSEAWPQAPAQVFEPQSRRDLRRRYRRWRRALEAELGGGPIARAGGREPDES